MNVLERQGMLAKTEVLEAIARLNVNTWVENPAKTPRSGPLQSRSGGAAISCGGDAASRSILAARSSPTARGCSVCRCALSFRPSLRSPPLHQ